MNNAVPSRAISIGEAEQGFAFGVGAMLLLIGLSRRSTAGGVVAAASVPFLYRGVTGRWPDTMARRLQPDSTRAALGGARGVHVRESVRIERPTAAVYAYWRHLENLPQFMTHLIEVTGTADGRSHWVAAGPGGLSVEWDAEIINDVQNRLIAWQSLPESDIVTAGSVQFAETRGGRGTQVTVHLQYAPPAGKAGAFVARLFGRAPGQVIRDDLRRFRQMLEAGEISRAVA